MHAGRVGDRGSACLILLALSSWTTKAAVTSPDLDCKTLSKEDAIGSTSHLSGYLSLTEEVETRRYRIPRCNLRLRHANLRRFRVRGSSIASSRQAASWPYRVSAKKSRREMLQDAALKPSTSTSRTSGTSAYAARVALERRWSHKGAPQKLQ
jgi:hypothetical protein